jgi:NADP-dependent 3-hydroxy acid dehydrogenase YdfG
MSNLRGKALITGATSGFGKAIATKLASQGYDVIITGRREERLESLRKELESEYHVNVVPLHFDVRKEVECTSALMSLGAEWRRIDVLVNNAGLAAGRDPFDTGSLSDWEQMIDTNLKGLIYVSRIVVQWMKERQNGTIINLGSIAGKEVYPGGNVYSATKFAVDALTRSMRIDLLPHHIRVGQIAPGAAETEFSLVRFKGDAEKASQVYEGFEPLHAEDIADAVWFMVSRPPHVCINDMVIMPSAQATSTHFNRKS